MIFYRFTQFLFRCFILSTRPLPVLAALIGAMLFFGYGGVTLLPMDLRGRAWAVAALGLVLWCVWQITLWICKITVEGRK